MARRGVMGRMIGRLLGRRPAPQELCFKDPWVGVDGGNGFGGQKLPAESMPRSNILYSLSGMLQGA